MDLSPSNILEFDTNAKYGIMAIFFHIKLQIMLDLLADTFIQISTSHEDKCNKIC